MLLVTLLVFFCLPALLMSFSVREVVIMYIHRSFDKLAYY